jgi:hypothetical protein
MISFSTGATARRMKLRDARSDDLKLEHGRVGNGPLKELIRNPSRHDWVPCKSTRLVRRRKRLVTRRLG